MKVYNKLVRDKIPNIIKDSGKECKTRILDDEEYLLELNKKLQEEVDEYKESGEVEELADIAEIIYAIAKFKGVSIEEFEKIRQRKLEERGGFEEKVFLGRVGEGQL